MIEVQNHKKNQSIFVRGWGMQVMETILPTVKSGERSRLCNDDPLPYSQHVTFHVLTIDNDCIDRIRSILIHYVFGDGAP